MKFLIILSYQIVTDFIYLRYLLLVEADDLSHVLLFFFITHITCLNRITTPELLLFLYMQVSQRKTPDLLAFFACLTEKK